MTTHHRPTRSDQPIFTPHPARPIVLAHPGGPVRRPVYDITTSSTAPPTRAELRQEIRAHRRARLRTTGPRWRTRLWPWLRAGGWLIAIAALIGLVWVGTLAVLALIAVITTALAWISEHRVVIGAAVVLVLAVVLLLFTGGGARCPGLHCGGCRD